MISSFVPCLYSTVPQYFEDMGYLSPTVKFLCRTLEPDNADKSLTWNIPSPRGICIGCNSLLWVLSCLSDKLHGTETTHNILRSLTLYRALDKLVYHVITKIFDRIRIYLNSSAYHIRKTNKYYTFNVFPERNARNVIFRFVVYTVGKVRVNPNLLLFGHVRFITEAS